MVIEESPQFSTSFRGQSFLDVLRGQSLETLLGRHRLEQRPALLGRRLEENRLLILAQARHRKAQSDASIFSLCHHIGRDPSSNNIQIAE